MANMKNSEIKDSKQEYKDFLKDIEVITELQDLKEIF